jgi:hypothetical protein
MQLMNSQMNVLSSTTNQLLEHRATLAQRAANRNVESVGREKSRLDVYEVWRKAQMESASEAVDSFKSLGGER